MRSKTLRPTSTRARSGSSKAFRWPRPTSLTATPCVYWRPINCDIEGTRPRRRARLELPVAAKFEQRVEERHQQGKRMLAGRRAHFGDRRCGIAYAGDVGRLQYNGAKETAAAIGLDTKLAITLTVARGRHQRDAKSAGEFNRPDLAVLIRCRGLGCLRITRPIPLDRRAHHDQFAQAVAAIGMRHKRAMPDEFRRVVLAVIDPPRFEQIRRRSNRPESCRSFGAVDLYVAGKALRFEHGEAAAPEHAQARIDVFRPKHQSVQAAWTFKHVATHGIRSQGQTDQLEIVSLEDDQMIDRAERMKAPRRDRETEPRHQRRRTIHVEQSVDHYMVKRKCHDDNTSAGSSPAPLILGTASTSSRVYSVCGSLNSARLSPCSTIKPLRKTMVRSHIMRTTLRS